MSVRIATVVEAQKNAKKDVLLHWNGTKFGTFLTQIRRKKHGHDSHACTVLLMVKNDCIGNEWESNFI